MKYNSVRRYYGRGFEYVCASYADIGMSTIWYYLDNKFSDKYYSYKSNLSFIDLNYTPDRVINEILNFNNFKRLSDGTEVNVLSCIVPSSYKDGCHRCDTNETDDEAIAKAMLICTGYLKPTDDISKIVFEFYNKDTGILEFKARIHGEIIDLYHIKDDEEEAIYLGEKFVDFAKVKGDIANFLGVRYILCDRSE